jgi:hypothetical protein
MRKVGCDCAWMKDREKQKIGPCPHVQALWMQYGLDEAQRRADLKAHPERIEKATAVYFKRKGDQEIERQVSLNRTRLNEIWNDSGTSPRYFHRVYSSIDDARSAYFKRLYDLKSRNFMDASQS